MKRLLALVLLAACQTPPAPTPDPAVPDKAPPPDAKPKAGAALPDGFQVKGQPQVLEAYLEAPAAWRDIRSRLSTLRADATARNLDTLVTFERGAVHATTRDGVRTTWKLPSGLALRGGPVHLFMGADLSMRLYRRDLSQVPLGAEVTVVTALVARGGGNVEEFRLSIKGGRTIRSISNAG
ncbi:MAG: hypothetical protein ACYTGN_14895 [Planctomycetota bacterium]|jgi:hypothetical protein